MKITDYICPFCQHALHLGPCRQKREGMYGYHNADNCTCENRLTHADARTFVQWAETNRALNRITELLQAIANK